MRWKAARQLSQLSHTAQIRAFCVGVYRYLTDAILTISLTTSGRRAAGGPPGYSPPPVTLTF